MHFLVLAPIGPGTRGPQVVNVGKILQLLVEHGVLKSYRPPDAPTSEQLGSLLANLDTEIDAATFGDAMRGLLVYLQIQQGLGDSLSGFVEESTAALLNDQVRLLTGHAATRPPPDLRMLSVFNPSFHVSTRKFRLRYRLEGEVRDRWLSLTPATLGALLALKTSAKYLVFNLTTKSFVGTDDLLR